jgi:lipid-binding SYLF domain-containing protein
MRRRFGPMLPIPLLLLLGSTAAWADSYGDTVTRFKNAGQSAAFFARSYGYAVFPTIDEGAFFVGGGHGKGKVFEHGRYVGDSSLSQLSFGAQLGGQAYSEIVFFQDHDAFERFTHGNFEFGADASAVAITAAASATASTVGAGAGASGDQSDATTAGAYHDGTAVFTIAKGGAMFQAAIGGQKFTFKPHAAPAKTAGAEGSAG